MAKDKDKKPISPKPMVKRDRPDANPEKRNENIRIPTYQDPPPPPPRKDT